MRNAIWYTKSKSNGPLAIGEYMFLLAWLRSQNVNCTRYSVTMKKKSNEHDYDQQTLSIIQREKKRMDNIKQ